MKYKTIGAFKNVQNVPYCKAAADMKVGMGVILDLEKGTATAASSEDTAKACYHIVSNINDKPEIRSSADAGVVLAGEYVRADDLTTVANREIEFAASEITTAMADLAVGDKLVFGADGVLVEEATTDSYKVYFTILEKTAYMGAGVTAVITVQ